MKSQVSSPNSSTSSNLELLNEQYERQPLVLFTQFLWRTRAERQDVVKSVKRSIQKRKAKRLDIDQSSEERSS